MQCDLITSQSAVAVGFCDAEEAKKPSIIFRERARSES
jgi:hypothetical protein